MAPVVYLVRILTELILIGAVAVGAASLVSGWVAVATAVAAAGVAIACWARFVAPRASRRLPDPVRFATEVALFVWGGAGLAVAGWPRAALTFVAVAVAAAGAMRMVGEPELPELDTTLEPPTR